MKILRTTSLLLFFLSVHAFGEDINSEKALSSALVATETEEERVTLLDTHSQLVTIELRKALISEGQQLKIKSNFPKALLAFELAKSVAERIGDEAGIAESLMNMGTITRILGNNQQALQKMQQSLVIAERMKDPSLIGKSLLYVGVAYLYMSDYDSALEYLNRCLLYSDSLEEKDLALAWNNIGLVNLNRGNFDEALKYLGKALVMREKIRDKNAIAGSFNNIAICYDGQGNYEQALVYYKKSLKIHEELGSKANMANVLNNMGDYRLLGSYELALKYNLKSLELATELGDKPLMARALGNIGNAYRKTGDYDLALQYGLKGLALAEELSDQSVTANELKNVSLAYHSKGDDETAMGYADRAVLNAKRIQNRQILWTALEAKGKIHRALHQPDQAGQAFMEAIATIEDWRAMFSGGDMGQSALFSEKVTVYKQMIDLLAGQNQNEQAWTYAERARARMLLDVLSSGRVNIQGAMTSQELEQEKKWNQVLAAQNRRIHQENLKDNPDQDLLEAYKAQLERLRLDFQGFRTNLYLNHPELKVHRVETEPVKLQEAGGAFHNARNAVLEYVVAEERTYIFLLTFSDSGSVQVEVHPIEMKHAALNTLVRNFREGIATRSAFRKDGSDLYDLLIGPIADQLIGKDELIILPDQALWELPFQVLVSPENQYLIEKHAISYAPSLSAVLEMKKMRRKRSNGTQDLLALGNPSLGKHTMKKMKSMNRENDLAPLPEAEREVNMLGRLYGKNSSMIYVGDQARESLIKSQGGKFRILHLATHGIVNDSMPMYSHLVLAQSELGEEEDGLLEAREIMNLKFAADLVVLSACESARGRVTTGEGVIGLTWALFIAGASTTVVSQWKVDSASTTDLMLAFHRNLEKESMRPAFALQQAALKLLHTTDYQHPFYWAGFVVIGDGL